MPCYDQHVHSRHSFDSKADPRIVVKSALKAGLAGVTFTEHFDTHPNEWDDCVYDDAMIARDIDVLRSEFGDQIFVGKGIEVCYQPERWDFILDFLSRHTFDVVLISVHWAFGKPVHERDHFADMSVEAYLANYLEAVCAAAEHLVAMHRSGGHPFHILGHMDFARRYAARFYDYHGPIRRLDLVEQILRNCMNASVIPEINTSTLRHGLAAPMPGQEVIQLYGQLGGRCMSLGSDAHHAPYVGQGFDVAMELLRGAGIGATAVFKKGRLRLEPLAVESSADRS